MIFVANSIKLPAAMAQQQRTCLALDKSSFVHQMFNSILNGAFIRIIFVCFIIRWKQILVGDNNF